MQCLARFALSGHDVPTGPATRGQSVVPHKFKITSAKGGQFAAKFLYNSEIMLWSENYVGKPNAKSCIDSLKKNAPGAPVVDLTKGESGKGYRFEIVASKDGQTYVRFVAANGEPMVRSETYKSKASARNCIESLKKRAADAPIEDEA